jgi:hypothetical protein
MPDFKEKSFEPKAHILSLLGEELIKNPVMAIYELVKNSYDADATIVNVIFSNPTNLANASIIIRDDGVGMSEEIIENVWLEPGTDFRKPVNNDGSREIIKSPIHKRVPMGEKGVGRFAVHKLSNKIKLITRPLVIQIDHDSGDIIKQELSDYEIHLTIDWNDFRFSKYLKDIKIRWYKKENLEEFYFKTHSGTRIELSDLKEEWNKTMARQLKRNVLSMTSPKIALNSFKINLDFKNNWLDGIPDTNQILEVAPYKFIAILTNDYSLELSYTFYPQNQEKIGKRSIDDKIDVKPLIENKLRQRLEIENIEEEKIIGLISKFREKGTEFGEILFEIYSYDLDANSLKDTSSEHTLIRSILKENAGIKVFKDDLRVYNYGEPGDDWLGLDLKRVNQPGSRVSNNQNIGYVFLNSEQSRNLVEKTNREGFIENSVFLKFKLVMDEIITAFEAERFKDRSRWIKLNKEGKVNSIENNFNEIKDFVNEIEFGNDTVKTRLLNSINHVEEKYEEQKNALLIPAGVGLTASVAIHEIEKLVPRLEENVFRNPLNANQLQENVAELKQYVSGILTILKKTTSQSVLVSEVIDKAIQNYKYKLEKRSIQPIIQIDSSITNINCERRYLITILMNLIDNSIYWLDTVYKENKAIFIRAFEKNGRKYIIYADNGPGFKDDISTIVTPFFTRKESGIGIGMYLIDTIMLQYGKLDILTDKSEIDEQGVPEEFKAGAVIELSFFKNQS